MYVFLIIMFYCVYGQMSEIKNYYYYFYKDDKSTKSICHWSSIPHSTRLLLNVFLIGLCNVYVS